MILQRMASAIKRQDWSQVLIEIFIVVIGIFLGLQVQAWYDGRVAAVEERRIIEYFIADLKKNTDVLEDRILFMDNQISKGYRILTLLEGEHLSQEDKADFEEGIDIMGRTNPLTAYLNSVNEENLNKILDVELRQILDGFVETNNRSVWYGILYW